MDPKPTDDDSIPVFDYEADIVVQMPGNAKPSTYRIPVKAGDPVEATARAIDEWKTRTEPCDVRVKKITPKTEKKE